MNFKELLDKRKIEKVEKKDINLSFVEKGIEFAEKGLKIKNYNWVMTVSYESVLKAGNKLMNFLGYRAIGKEHHKNLFKFLKKMDIDRNLINYFNKIRIKRNNFIYRDAEKVSKEEAEEIVEKAKEIVLKIRTFVRKNRTGKNSKGGK